MPLTKLPCRRCQESGVTSDAVNEIMRKNYLTRCPPACCPVCFYRYGRYIPVCRPLSALKKEAQS